jgi:hypothetical protein
MRQEATSVRDRSRTLTAMGRTLDARRRRASAVGAALAATAALSVVGVSLADTQHDNGDLGGSPSPNLFYGGGSGHDCATRGTPISGDVRLSYGGGSDHFAAGAPVTLDVTADLAATAAHIDVAQTGSTSIPATWNASTPDVHVAFTTTVPAGTADGVYKVEVVARTGTVSAPGKHTYAIHVHCTGPVPANTAPDVSDVTGDSPVDEGTDHTYGVTTSDPDGDALTYAWSVVTGEALIPGDATADSVSVHFSDGPSNVVLQVVVDDGSGHTVTRTKTITEADVAPTTTITSGDSNVDEGAAAHTYAYTISDPGNDDQTPEIGCGALGAISNEAHTDAGGSFDCTFPDGAVPATTSAVTVQATDSDGLAGNKDTKTVTVNNVTPVVAGLTLGANTGTACLAGKTVTLGVSFGDPGADSLWKVDINWGDGSHTTYDAGATGAQAPRSHVYVGAGAWTVSASVTDKDLATGSGSSAANAVQLLYSTGQGILQPINYTGPRSAFKIGSTIPVKIKITDCAGTPVSGLLPQVTLKFGDPVPDGTSLEDVVSTVPDQGTTMRYTGSPDYQYIYNMATKTRTMGDYTVYITDPTIPTVSAVISLKK